jgi:hypothetical protein
MWQRYSQFQKTKGMPLILGHIFFMARKEGKYGLQIV